jgi:hypothetical protein
LIALAEDSYGELSSDDPQFAAKIRDRLHYTWLLQEQVRTFQKSVVNIDFGRTQLEDAIKGLVAMIPDVWKETDEEWKADYGKATKEVTVDIRPSFALVKMSKELCRKKGIQITKKVKITDYFIVLQAVFNKLFRMGMLSKREWTEATTGMPPGETALPEGMNLQEMNNYIFSNRVRIKKQIKDFEARAKAKEKEKEAEE